MVRYTLIMLALAAGVAWVCYDYAAYRVQWSAGGMGAAQESAKRDAGYRLAMESATDARLCKIVEDPTSTYTPFAWEEIRKRGIDDCFALLAEDVRRRIAELGKKVRPIPASDVSSNLRIYRQLAALDPENRRYQEKVRDYERLLPAYERRKRDMASNPKRFVEIVRWSWDKGGFESILVASFLIRNTLWYAVKDVKLRCDIFAESGTKLGSLDETAYRVFPAGRSTWVNDLSMGFLHSQVSTVACRITDFERVR